MAFSVVHVKECLERWLLRSLYKGMPKDMTFFAVCISYKEMFGMGILCMNLNVGRYQNIKGDIYNGICII